MVGGRSTARTAWAALVGVVIGAALLAFAREPAPAGSATHVRTPVVTHGDPCAPAMPCRVSSR
jgi:hypothetical protein